MPATAQASSRPWSKPRRRCAAALAGMGVAVAPASHAGGHLGKHEPRHLGCQSSFPGVFPGAHDACCAFLERHRCRHAVERRPRASLRREHHLVALAALQAPERCTAAGAGAPPVHVRERHPAGIAQNMPRRVADRASRRPYGLGQGLRGFGGYRDAGPCYVRQHSHALKRKRVVLRNPCGKRAAKPSAPCVSDTLLRLLSSL